MRLRRPSQFRAVLSGGIRKSAGPITVYALPNEVGRPRLGMAISRRVGGAVTRNRMRRRMREAFRLQQHDLGPGYDLVISARPHELLTLAEYQHLLAKAARQLHRSWTNHANLSNEPPASLPGR